MNCPRSPWLDNAKGILIILVIFGHLIEQMASVSVLGAGTYGAIYLFHMPAFALISGMLSRASLSRGSIVVLTRKLLLPLAIFQVLYWPVLAYLTPYMMRGILTPQWILWFLLSLAIWRLTLGLALRMPFPVVTAVAAALAVGFVDSIDQTLSLSRTFVFFPAFLVGHIYRREIEAISSRLRSGGAVLLVILAGISGVLVAHGGSVIPLYGSLPYSSWTDDLVVPAITRLVVIAAGIAATIAFLSLIPKRAGALTNVGRQTLPVLLLHGFLVLIFWAVTPTQAMDPDLAFLFISAAFAILIAFGLASAAQEAISARLVHLGRIAVTKA